MNIVRLEIVLGQLRLRATDKHLLTEGAVTNLSVERIHDDGHACHVVAVIEMHREPSIRFVGMRPFDENYEHFMSLCRLAFHLMGET